MGVAIPIISWQKLFLWNSMEDQQSKKLHVAT